MIKNNSIAYMLINSSADTIIMSWKINTQVLYIIWPSALENKPYVNLFKQYNIMYQIFCSFIKYRLHIKICGTVSSWFTLTSTVVVLKPDCFTVNATCFYDTCVYCYDVKGITFLQCYYVHEYVVYFLNLLKVAHIWNDLGSQIFVFLSFIQWYYMIDEFILI